MNRERVSREVDFVLDAAWGAECVRIVQDGVVVDIPADTGRLPVDSAPIRDLGAKRRDGTGRWAFTRASVGVSRLSSAAIRAGDSGRTRPDTFTGRSMGNAGSSASSWGQPPTGVPTCASRSRPRAHAYGRLVRTVARGGVAGITRLRRLRHVPALRAAADAAELALPTARWARPDAAPTA